MMFLLNQERLSYQPFYLYISSWFHFPPSLGINDGGDLNGMLMTDLSWLAYQGIKTYSNLTI